MYVIICFRLFMNCFLISCNFRILHGSFHGHTVKVFSWVLSLCSPWCFSWCSSWRFFCVSLCLTHLFVNPFQDSALEALVSGGPPRNFRAPPTGTIRNPEPKPALALKTIKQDLFVVFFSFFFREHSKSCSFGIVSFGLRLKPRQIPLQNPKKSQPKQALSVEDRSILPGIRFALLLR